MYYGHAMNTKDDVRPAIRRMPRVLVLDDSAAPLGGG
ncbi:MAG: hypothetical protein JWN40_3770 [Phycisphaerales bacterium]|nr:hypothetical protein [Phycisphaerales bacterium]